MDINGWLARFKRHIGQLLAVGRPGGRNNGLGTAERTLRTLAIRIGHPQVEILSAFGDIRNACGEDAFVTCQLLVDVIGNFVRCKTQISLHHRLALGAHILAPHRIPQVNTHIKTSVSQSADTAGQQRVGILLAPVGKVGA